MTAPRKFIDAAACSLEERPLMRSAFAATSAALLVISTPGAVRAQAASPGTSTSPIAAGMTVKDPQGGFVGTVTATAGELITVRTDKHVAQLPRTSVRLSGDYALIAMTQSQLNNVIEQQIAAAQSQLTTGAKVVGLQGTVVGTIEALDDQYATLKLASGKLIKLKRNALGGAPDGARIGMTAEALEAQVAATRSQSTKE